VFPGSIEPDSPGIAPDYLFGARATLVGVDAAGWDARYAASELVWSAEPNQFVAEVCADLSPGRALDLAAGEGRNAIWLAQRGWTVTATDFSRVGLDKGRQLADHAGVAERIAWVVADATTTDWPPDFDLVVVAYLQLVEAERQAAVQRGFAALQPGGRFVLVAHDSSNLTEGTGGPPDPAVLMTAEDVLIDLTGEPFEVVRAERVPRAVEDRTAYDCLVVLERD
jgi:SAM-dependent methyltransferase